MFRGSMVALATPMHEGGDVDIDALEHLIEFHISNGTEGIVSVGTTGESATLTPTEHLQVIDATVKAVAARVPVIAGTGSNSTHEAIDMSLEAAALGADAVLLVTPYYNKPTQHGLLAHYEAIASSVSVPQILYNVPGRTAVDMLPETVAEASKADHIVGIKEATGSLERLAEIKALVADDFILLSGDDASSREFMLQGGDGVISVTANVAPKLMSQLCMTSLAGEHEKAAEIDRLLVGLHNNLFVEANPIPVKWCLYAMGLMQADIRLPLTVLSEEYQPMLAESLAKAKIMIGSENEA